MSDIIGYINLSSEYPEIIDTRFLNENMSQASYGIDILFQEPLIIRQSERIAFKIGTENVGSTLTDYVILTSNSVLRWLKLKQKTIEVILCFKVIYSKWDVRVVVGAYEKQ